MTFIDFIILGFVVNTISVMTTGQPFSICVSGCM